MAYARRGTSVRDQLDVAIYKENTLIDLHLSYEVCELALLDLYQIFDLYFSLSPQAMAVTWSEEDDDPASTY